MGLLTDILKFLEIKESKSDWKRLKKPPKWVLKRYGKIISTEDTHQELIWIIKGKYRIYKIIPIGVMGSDHFDLDVKVYYKNKRKKK